MTYREYLRYPEAVVAASHRERNRVVGRFFAGLFRSQPQARRASPADRRAA